MMTQCDLYQTQHIFRKLMESLSNPGVIFTINRQDCSTPLIYHLCQTLLDNTVTFSVVGNKVDETFINDIIIQTGSQYVDIAEASFAIVCGENNGNTLQNINIGTLEYPETGSTVIYVVNDLLLPGEAAVKLTGPGIKNSVTISLQNISKNEFISIKNINSDYPLGIDIIFCDSKSILSIPRSSLIEIL